MDTMSWWADPSVQRSYTAFAAAVQRELPRMETAPKTWPVDRGVRRDPLIPMGFSVYEPWRTGEHTW